MCLGAHVVMKCVAIQKVFKEQIKSKLWQTCQLIPYKLTPNYFKS